MIGLIFDTETTGLPLYAEPSDHPDQPHIAQIAAVLMDLDTRSVIASMDTLIKPTGWLIPPSVTQIHGISTEKATRFGVTEDVAVAMFMALHAAAEVRIAHNQPFDARIIRIALKRYRADEAMGWSAAPAHCTMQMATPIMKLPPSERMVAKNRGGHKSPNLGEAYLHFTGRELKGGHRAMVDVQGCMEVYFAITQGPVSA